MHLQFRINLLAALITLINIVAISSSLGERSTRYNYPLILNDLNNSTTTGRRLVFLRQKSFEDFSNNNNNANNITVRYGPYDLYRNPAYETPAYPYAYPRQQLVQPPPPPPPPSYDYYNNYYVPPPAPAPYFFYRPSSTTTTTTTTTTPNPLIGYLLVDNYRTRFGTITTPLAFYKAKR